MRFARTGVKVAALAVVGATALAACGKSSNSGTAAPSGFTGIPAPSAHKVPGGTVTFGMPTGDTPNWIFPVTPSSDSSVYTAFFFQNMMYRPLWWSPVSDKLDINYAASLAKKPVFSADTKTVTITLNPTYKWSNGESVTADDVILDINMITAAVAENPANFGAFTPGFFPQNIASATKTSPDTVVLQLTKAANPSYTFLSELSTITPLPLAWDVTKFGNAADSGGCLADSAADKWAKCKAVYDYLSKQSSDLSSYATNPIWQVVDGPFKLSAFNASTNANTMVANPAYTGPNKPIISTFQQVAFTSDTAEFNALKAGGLTFGIVPSADYPQIPSLKSSGFNVYGGPDFGWEYMYFNFKNTTDNWNSVIGQLYVRQALAHLVDNAGYIKAIFHGYAVPAYGPLPSAPLSKFTPSTATVNPYPFSIATAKSILAAHGWKIEGGVQTCVNAGSGASQCGTGIPAGQKLTIQLMYNSGSPAITSEDTAYASDAKSAGIPITLKGATFNNLIAQEDNPADKSNINGWQMADFGGFTQSLYPTTNGVFNTQGSFNMGSYSDPTADSLINNSVYGSDPQAVSKEVAYLTKSLPGLFQAEADHVYAWKNTLSGPQSSFWEVPQFTIDPNEWYFTK
jgi:peptide/nickel transport system substrate-binding protein